jgi:hypothetical protein
MFISHCSIKFLSHIFMGASYFIFYAKHEYEKRTFRSPADLSDMRRYFVFNSDQSRKGGICCLLLLCSSLSACSCLELVCACSILSHILQVNFNISVPRFSSLSEHRVVPLWFLYIYCSPVCVTTSLAWARSYYFRPECRVHTVVIHPLSFWFVWRELTF